MCRPNNLLLIDRWHTCLGVYPVSSARNSIGYINCENALGKIIMPMQTELHLILESNACWSLLSLAIDFLSLLHTGLLLSHWPEHLQPSTLVLLFSAHLSGISRLASCDFNFVYGHAKQVYKTDLLQLLAGRKCHWVRNCILDWKWLLNKTFECFVFFVLIFHFQPRWISGCANGML